MKIHPRDRLSALVEITGTLVGFTAERRSLSSRFHRSDSPEYAYDLRKPFEKACEAAGIEGLRIHDLRHSFATLAIQGGASLYDVQTLLGHSDISMTQRYAHMVDDSLQKATDNMAGMIDRAINTQ